MKWKDEYSIGVEEIDNQHKELVKLIGRFQDLLSGNIIDLEEEMGNIIIFLVNYANYHFEAEEALMKRIEYPNLDQHKIIHKNLILQLKEVLVKLKTKKSYKPIEFYYFLIKWLTDHISMEDKKIGISYKKWSKIQKKPTTSSLKDPAYVIKFIEPNFQKLDMMEKNHIINSEDKTKKKMDYLNRFYSSFQIDCMKSIYSTIESLDMLLEKNYLTHEEETEIGHSVLESAHLEQLLTEANCNVEDKMKLVHTLLEKGIYKEEEINILKQNFTKP